MNRYVVLFPALAAIIAVVVPAPPAAAGTLTTSPTAPTGGILASQLTDVGPGVFDGGRNYVDNGGPPGQTFTVTAAGAANRFTVLGRGDSSDAWSNGVNPWEGDEIWGFQLSSVNTGTGAATVLATEAATGFTGGGATNIADYLTFTLGTPVSLNTGVTYMFSLYLASADPGNAGVSGADGGWFGLAHSDTDVYATGSAVNNNASITNPGGNGSVPRRNFPIAGTGFAAPVPDNYDYVFAVQAGGLAPGPGDVNEDTFTNLTDYGIIKSNFFLSPATRMQGDLNGDGRVSLADFGIWRNIVPAAMAASASIPEPTSAMLALLVSGAGLRLVRRRSSR